MPNKPSGTKFSELTIGDFVKLPVQNYGTPGSFALFRVTDLSNRRLLLTVFENAPMPLNSNVPELSWGNTDTRIKQVNTDRNYYFGQIVTNVGFPSKSMLESIPQAQDGYGFRQYSYRFTDYQSASYVPFWTSTAGSGGHYRADTEGTFTVYTDSAIFHTRYYVSLVDCSVLSGLGTYSDPYILTVNQAPTLTLTNPADNLSLSEGSTYELAGTASDPDNGNAVTVKYAINGGTARNITSAISDGTTPIPFSKTLTFQNGRLYDGGTDVSGPLAENTTYTVSVYAVDDQGGTSTAITRSFTVILNRPPTINLDPYNANQTGVSELETLTFTGTLTDPENDTITLTAAFNGGAPVTIKSAVASGTTFTYSVPVSSLAQGSNTVVFTATDPKGASSTKTLTFTKSGTFTPVKTAVVRYAITPPLGTTAEIAAWVQREAGDLTVDAAASIVGSADPENYVALTKNASVPLGDGTIVEDEFVGSVGTPGAKVTLRLTLTRSSSASTKAVKKIMGGIG